MIGALTNHVWQSTLFAAAAALSTAAFRGNRAKVRYWLWFCASVKFLLPFSLLIALGSHLGWKTPAVRAALPAATFTMIDIAEPFTPGTTPVPTGRATDWLPMAALGAWICGFVSIAAWRFRQWRRIARVVRASNPASSSRFPMEVRLSRLSWSRA